MAQGAAGTSTVRRFSLLWSQQELLKKGAVVMNSESTPGPARKTNEKWALVTGSSRGLGFLLAHALATAGYGVVLTGRDSQSLGQAEQDIRALGIAPCMGVCLDLAEPGAPAKLHSAVKAKDVSLAVIVNCLGGGVPGDRRNIPTETLHRAMRLNLEVGIEVNNLFYEDMAAQRGVIVHIGSTAALHFDAPPGYVISKHAINAYVKNAAKTFAREGVCIFAVLPGILDYTDSYIDKLRRSDPERSQKALEETTYGRFTTGSELARFLVAIIEHGTPMLNGSLVQFDGGKE